MNKECLLATVPCWWLCFCSAVIVVLSVLVGSCHAFCSEREPFSTKCTLGSSLMLSIYFLLPVSLEDDDDEMVPLISSQGAIRKFGKAVW